MVGLLRPHHFHDLDSDLGYSGDDSFGNDYLAGGPQHDLLFGQLGDDTIQGDGSIESALPETGAAPVYAYRDGANELRLRPSVQQRDGHPEGGAGERRRIRRQRETLMLEYRKICR